MSRNFRKDHNDRSFLELFIWVERHDASNLDNFPVILLVPIFSTTFLVEEEAITGEVLLLP